MKDVRVERLKLFKVRPKYLVPPVIEELNFRDKEEFEDTSSDSEFVEQQPPEVTANANPVIAPPSPSPIAAPPVDQFIPKPGDHVGIFFHREVNDGRNWYCGTVTKVDTPMMKAYVTFRGKEHQQDNDWYPINHEMRLCPKTGHRCRAGPQFMIESILAIDTGKTVITPENKLGNIIRKTDNNCLAVYLINEDRTVNFHESELKIHLSAAEKQKLKNIKKREKKKRRKMSLAGSKL